MDQSNQHEALLGSDHFPEFVEFLVAEKLLDRLLLKTLQAGREQDARQLVAMYMKEHHFTCTPGADCLKVSSREEFAFLNQRGAEYSGTSIEDTWGPAM